jgi:hypothetical protein
MLDVAVCGTEMENKSLLVSIWCLIALQCLVVMADRYTSRYDNVDLDSILSNKRALNAFVKCLLEKGPCSPEGKELKGKSWRCNHLHSYGAASAGDGRTVKLVFKKLHLEVRKE